MVTFTSEVSLVSFNSASPLLMERLYCEKYMRGHVAIMSLAERLWLKLLEQGSIGQQQQPMDEI
jgi:hypothetical protein